MTKDIDIDLLAPQARRERAEQIAAAHAHDEADGRIPWWVHVEVGVAGCNVATCDR